VKTRETREERADGARDVTLSPPRLLPPSRAVVPSPPRPPRPRPGRGMDAAVVPPPHAPPSVSSSSSSSDSDDDAPAALPMDADLAHVAALLAGGGGAARRSRGAVGAARAPPRLAGAYQDPGAPVHVRPDYATPGPRSTRERAHCAACDCAVPHASWGAHVRGLRHTRATLGAALTGGRRAVAVTPFEAPPPARRARRGPTVADPDLSSLQSTATRELLRHVGVTDGGARLAERFSVDRLAAARAAVASARALAKFGEVRLLAATPATLACVAAAVGGEKGGRGVSGLLISLDGCHAADAPAAAAGLVLLARALAANDVLRLLRVDAADVDVDGPAAARVWRAVLAALQAMLLANDTLQALHLNVQPGSADQADVDRLLEAAAAAPGLRRAALLSAAHPRVSAHACPFSHLPVHLMAAIADAGVRRRGCSVVVKCDGGGGGGGR